MSETFTTAGPRTIHGAAHGSGRPVVLVPGLGGGRRLFGTLPRRFARHGMRAVTFDPLGIPPSAALPGRFDFDAAADDLWSVVDAAGQRQVTLVGTSLGGKVAMIATQRRPDRVERLVLLASSAVVTGRSRRIYRYFETIAELLPADRFADAVAPFLFGRTFQEQRSAVVDDIVRATRPAEATRALMIAQARALQTFDGTAAARSIAVPTLCLAGEEDTLTEVTEVARTAALIAGARLEVVAGAGHSLLLESATTFERLVDFLDR